MSRTLRAVSVAVLACAGAFVIPACLISLNFEVSGFGRQADTPLRVPYVTSLVVAVMAGVAVPTAAAMVLLGPSGRVATAVVGALILLGLLAFLGLRIF
jgi:hypothetical protein